MTFKELRRASGMTLKEFAEFFGISQRTVENWGCGRTTPPDYLIRLMEYRLKNEGIIETIENPFK